jgi:transposase InsO family protein
MHQQAQIAVAAGDRSVNRTRLATELGMSRQWLSVLIARFNAEQFDGLAPRSRAPKRPAQCAAAVEDMVVWIRKQLADDGLDHGPVTIQWHLREVGLERVPSVATIWRICQRRGLVAAQPKKRPNRSWCRFEFAAPNECWQIDCTAWTLGNGRPVMIVNVLDDHSRVCTASVAAATASCETAWQALCIAAQQWGLPAMVLSDNGTEFTAQRFVENLGLLGVRTVTSRPRHPQTCGKVERFHATLKQHLAKQPDVTTLTGLQHQLDRFLAIYNEQRPNRAIGRQPPAERWAASPAAAPGPPRLEPRRVVTTTTVGNTGAVLVRPWHIALGSRWRHQRVTVFVDDLDIAVFAANGDRIRSLHIDPNRRYQPLTNT